jgi:uncharacterized protein (DUF2384 family)
MATTSTRGTAKPASGRLSHPLPSAGRTPDEHLAEAASQTLAQLRGSWGLLGPAVRTEMVIAGLGTADAAAKLLGVSKSQPSRWRTGQERPSSEMQRLLLDLDHVIGRAHLLFTPEVALDWLTGSNSYLDGARPIDVLKQRGSTEVIEALDAAMQGAYS